MGMESPQSWGDPETPPPRWRSQAFVRVSKVQVGIGQRYGMHSRVRWWMMFNKVYLSSSLLSIASIDTHQHLTFSIPIIYPSYTCHIPIIYTSSIHQHHIPIMYQWTLQGPSIWRTSQDLPARKQPWKHTNQPKPNQPSWRPKSWQFRRIQPL